MVVAQLRATLFLFIMGGKNKLGQYATYQQNLRCKQKWVKDPSNTKNTKNCVKDSGEEVP